MAQRSTSAKSALIDWIGADFNKTGASQCPDKCTSVHQHINYTINNTTITNYFNAARTTSDEPDYLKQMREDLIASGKYGIRYR
jgi:hypothetical protein